MNSLNLPNKYMAIGLLADEIEENEIYCINKELCGKVDIGESIEGMILNYFVFLNSQRRNLISKYTNMYFYSNSDTWMQLSHFGELLLKPITAEEVKEKLDNYLLSLYSLCDITDEFLKALNSLDFAKIKSDLKETYLQNGHPIESGEFKNIFRKQISDENHNFLLDFVLYYDVFREYRNNPKREAIFDTKIVSMINDKAKELQNENEKLKALCEKIQSQTTFSSDTLSKEFLYSIKFAVLCHEIFCDLVLMYVSFFKYVLVDQKYVSVDHEKDNFIILDFIKKALQNSINLSAYLQSGGNDDDKIKQIAFCGFEMPEFKERPEMGCVLRGGYVFWDYHNLRNLNKIINMCGKLRPKGVKLLRDFIDKIEKFEAELIASKTKRKPK